ncbi:MAG: cell division protein FtsA [Lactobacillaceae bacterium]|jgi:cell division protein FtsA|nr:cell division protein FtsA [Lactobacillaceae bacterium]
MNNNVYFAGLDIGSSSIKLVVLMPISNGSLVVAGMSNLPSKGVKNGVVTNIDELSSSIHEVLEDIFVKTGIQISSVIVGIPPTMAGSRLINGNTNINPDENNERRINEKHIQKVTQSVLANAMTLNRDINNLQEVIDIVPEEFLIDQFGNIESPIGMVGATLEMRANVYVAPQILVEAYRSAISKAGLNIEKFVLSNYAFYKYVLDEQDALNGAITIDFGAEQTTLTVIKDNSINYVTSVSKGGRNITLDILNVLNETFSNLGMDFKTAEDLKRSKGIADPLTIQNDQIINVVSTITGNLQEVSGRYVSEIIVARLKEIINELYERLVNDFGNDIPNYNIVISGGAAALTGINEFLADVLDRRSILYIPSDIGARDPAWSNVIAISHTLAGQNSTDKAINGTLINGTVNLNRSFNTRNDQLQVKNLDSTSSNVKKSFDSIKNKIKDALGKIKE